MTALLLLALSLLLPHALVPRSLGEGGQARFTTTRDADVIQLKDAATATQISLVESLCNPHEMSVKGQQLIRQTFANLDAFRARPGLNGIPLLAPFANRLDEQAFWANGKRYAFDMTLGNVRGEIPIHGFLSSSKDWKVVEAKSDASAAWVTCRLDFYRNPAWIKQFPFAHTMTLTHRLSADGLEVRFRIDNLSTDPMPVAIGFHPYFQLTDSPRTEWTLSVPARTHWKLDARFIPTGETEPADKFFADPQRATLAGVNLDDVFTDLVRDAEGRAKVTVRGKSQQLEVLIGPNYKALVMYSPDRPQNFVAIEPMVGITDSMNLAQKGIYKELQSIPPGGSWQESFWIRASGY